MILSLRDKRVLWVFRPDFDLSPDDVIDPTMPLITRENGMWVFAAMSKNSKFCRACVQTCKILSPDIRTMGRANRCAGERVINEEIERFAAQYF
ncbi:MAG: hypothetical protein NT180_05195 [Actinobacteria bacterium]|nr:hypothetical protein [Actinomycetota bacterium]